ncbi:DUF3558 domain-containing protein [Streptomyces sp. PSKA54]|uniref:DUF3558 domain-containing protein n=1 Tax=Streptomyces himalayensis subsp. aureolus TaxID=2758039 RepID=A0A7W2D4A9_9ACTN|nr:DUF3558 domain-containing protein [Streptomyces himalayensis]MBA4864485.1 DUF3558 domain-containing protein [Streptomyces himalayensis subsp. aureolus]
MQRKAYVPGVAALLAALLAGCTSSSGSGEEATDSKPGATGTSASAAQPGKYRTLPEPCGALDHGTLDSLLPGIKEMTDEEQQEKAYDGTATVTYDTDRRVGCRWKVESADATHHLHVDFERVVSYDATVSDDTRAQAVFATKEEAANLPEPADPREEKASSSPSASTVDADSASSGAGSESASGSASSSAPSSSPSSSDDGSATDGLEPRFLDDLGDEAFLDDVLTTSTSTARHRTVTVAFRTSNVIVTIEYDEQPASILEVPDSREMQDRAQKLAQKLAERLSD